MALTDTNIKSKPASDLDVPETDPTPSRRRFLTWGIYGVGAATAVALAVPAVGYFIAPVVGGNTDLKVPVGNVADFANQTTPKQLDVNYEYQDEFKKVSGTIQVFVQAVKANAAAANDFRILSPICTHLGCLVTWEEAQKHFNCPCHGSVFDAEGKVLKTPANKPLNNFNLSVDNGKLVINPLQTFGL